jgi:alpha-beta hydrolase superfamily lysophospholipase
MRESPFVYQSADGVDVYVHGWLPESGAPRAVLQVVHGMSEHGARYARLAERFTAAGYAVYASDHRGHGKTAKSERDLGKMGGLDAFRRVVSDVHGVNCEIAARHAGAPIVLLGHSMGSFIAQQLMYEHPGDMAGVVLSASNGRPPPLALAGRLLAHAEARRLGGDGSSAIMQRLTFDEFNRAFAPNRTPCDWLSRDEAEVDKYVADPLCGFPCSVHSWHSLLRALAVMSDPANQARIPRGLPVLLAAGAQDPVGEFGAGVRRLAAAYARVGLRDVTLELYPGARHEILNETNRDEVEADVFAFAERVVAAHKPEVRASA